MIDAVTAGQFDDLPAAALSVRQFRSLILSAVAAAQIETSRKTASEIERVSAARAAAMVGKRRALILDACASGALKATFSGKSWSIRVGDLDEWAKAGFPV